MARRNGGHPATAKRPYPDPRPFVPAGDAVVHINPAAFPGLMIVPECGCEMESEADRECEAAMTAAMTDDEFDRYLMEGEFAPTMVCTRCGSCDHCCRCTMSLDAA